MNYDPNKLKPYLEQKNDATNKELYSLCNATTDGQKGSIRKLKSRILKAIEKGETAETPKQKTIKKVQAQVPPRIENQDSVDESWFEMEDPELSRHTYREILLNKESTVRERLEAASKLVDLKYKSGTLDTKTQSERKVIDKFRQQDTKTLVSMLKESSQKGHS